MIFTWQEAAWKNLMARRQRLGHALLLFGKPGIGKLKFAQVFSQAMLCESPQAGGFPCGTCSACRWFGQGSHPDLRVLEPDASVEREVGESDARKSSSSSSRKPSRQISVDQVRALADFVGVSAHRNGLKVILVHPAEALNPSAANALLKTLEEPPPDTVFLLVSHRPRQLLPTVLSRCVQLPMPVPDPESAKIWLQAQGISDAETCLAEAGYSPLLALTVSDREYRARREAFLELLAAPDRLHPLGSASQLESAELPMLVDWLQRWCYDLQTAGLSRGVRYHPHWKEKLFGLAGGLDMIPLARFQARLTQAQRHARHTLNPKLFIEELLINYQLLFLRGSSGHPGRVG